MFTRNAGVIGSGQQQQQQQSITKNERVELFSTDSEMDSFFKENENILNNSSNANMLSSSSTTTGGGGAGRFNDENSNTMNEDFDDVEFDRIAAEANRFVLLYFKSNEIVELSHLSRFKSNLQIKILFHVQLIIVFIFKIVVGANN